MSDVRLSHLSNWIAGELIDSIRNIAQKQKRVDEPVESRRDCLDNE